MKFITIFASLLLSFASTTAFSADCVSKAEMTEIASHFTQFSSLAQNDFCFDGSQTSNLLASIMFMRKTAFSADMKKSQDELFSGRFSTSWYNYFIGRINDMNVQSDCPKGVAAYVYGFGGKTMYVCPSMLTDSFSALDRTSIFMHEARHIDGFPHVTCTHGAREGLQGACDSKISDGGSYAVTVETYAQLAKYATDLNPALKAYARASAVIYADEAFETTVKVNREFQMLVMTKNRDLFSVAGSDIQPLGQSPSLGHIAMRAHHMILFPEDKTLPAKFLFVNNAGEINQAAGDMIIEYNAQTPAQRAEMVDYHIAAQWNARIYKSKVTFSCNPTVVGFNDVALKDVTPVAILHLNGYDRVAKSSYLLMQSGELYEFGCQNKAPFVKKSSVTVDQPYKRVHKIGQMIVGLTNDGHLFEIKDGKSTPLSVGNLDGQIYEIAPRQTFSFFDVALAK